MREEPRLPHPVTGALFASPVPAGCGWPDDPADARTPVARTAEQVAELATGAADLAELEARESVCRTCDRLVRWREEVARGKRRSYAAEPYWGRPIPGWGAERPRILIVGLAPAAHGGNRTGRIFTGDRSGDWLFAGLHRAGLATLPTSRAAGDGQRLLGVRMVAAVRCAPPDNKPTPRERDNCFPWLLAEYVRCAPSLACVVALGSFAWTISLRLFATAGLQLPRPRPRFGHGAELELDGIGAWPAVTLLGCFHPSQQNTFTGKLTESMLDAVLGRAASLAGLPGPAADTSAVPAAPG